jgi:hypothetical protein
MKALKLFVFSLIAFSFSGCDEELFDIKFGLNTKDVTFTIPATSVAGEIILDPTTQSINLDSLASANGADISKIKSVKAKKITAIIESPATADFGILQSGFITIEAPGVPNVHIAEISSAPGAVKEFEIIPLDVNLLDYARKPQLTVAGKLVTNGPVLEAVTVKLKIEFEVVANPVAGE